MMALLPQAFAPAVPSAWNAPPVPTHLMALSCPEDPLPTLPPLRTLD